MHLSYQFLLSFIMTFVFIGIIIIIYSRYNDRKAIANTFNLFVACVALWCASMAMFYFSTFSDIAIFWARAQFFTGSLVASSIVFFSLLYPSEKFSTPVYQRILVFLPNAIFYYLCFFTPFIVTDVTKINGSIGWVRGSSSAAWHIYFIFACSFAFFRFFKKYKTTLGTIKERFRLIIAAFIIGILVSAIPSILMPWLLNRFEFYWMGAPLTSIWVVFIAYVIFKKPLMEIPQILQRSLLYALLFLLLALLQFVIVLSVRMFFPIVAQEFALMPFGVSILFLLIFLLPLKNFVTFSINKYVFSKNYFKIAEENQFLKEEVAQAEKYKSLATLFNRIIFEIKNPLTILKGYSYCLPEKCGDKEFLSNFAVTLRDEVDRINNLVNHLTEYNRSSALALKEVDIYGFLDETVDILKNNFLKENISVIKKYQRDGMSKIYIDPKQLRQALLNIFVNSIDAMPNGGTINIETSIMDKTLKIFIIDSGEGISRDISDKVFKPFFTTKKDNQGLGLSVSLGIIEGHGGAMHIESEENTGTEIVIDLPKKTSFDVESAIIKIG